jgi:hypothetical protein
MFTLTQKLRTIVAISAVGAALASSAVASAAISVHQPGAGTRVVTSRLTTVGQIIDPNKVGSAGIPGYDDQACEDLANDANLMESNSQSAASQAQQAPAGSSEQQLDQYNVQADSNLASEIEQELSENCFVID